MDSLSRLLSLLTVHANLDLRCALAAPWVLQEETAAPGTAPFHIVIDGNASFESVAGERVDLDVGDVVVFPHGAPHTLYAGAPELATPVLDAPGPGPLHWKANAGPGPLAGVLCGRFVFAENGREALLRALPDVIVVRTANRPDFAGLHALVMMLRDETEAARPGGGVVIGQLTAALFTLLVRAWLEQSASTPGLFAVLADDRLGAAVQAMLEFPGKPWQIDDLAHTCNMSRATFARVFRERCGMTPAETLLEIRMAIAAAWLVRDRVSTGSVAEAVGYQSEAAFHRVFKRHFKVGPGEYRRSARAMAYANPTEGADPHA